MGVSECSPWVPLLSRVISRAQGLKLVVETLMSSLKPIGNIVVICCAFFIIFGIINREGFGVMQPSFPSCETSSTFPNPSSFLP